MCNLLLDIVGLSFLNNKNGLFTFAEVDNLLVYQWVDAVEHQHVDLGITINIGKPDAVQGADHSVIGSA